MNETPIEKVEKVQFEGVIDNEKVIITDEDCTKEFYNSSYIGTLEKNSDGGEILVLGPLEVLLLCERNRILLYKNNEKNNDLYDFEGLLT
ncbi:MAG: hypothetical protein ACTSQW_09670, partial [Promethearchaeota archaeon]